jgi:hypothetical protein
MKKEKIIGHLLMWSGIITYTYFIFFEVESLENLAFTLVGFATAMSISHGMGILHRLEEKKDSK